MDAGVSLYGYREYSPVMGRWVSRDPGPHWAGANRYAMLDNAPCGDTDYLGLWGLGPLVLDIPKRSWKCDYAAWAISLSAQVDQHNAMLWGHYVSGSGLSVELDMSQFDPVGGARAAAFSEAVRGRRGACMQVMAKTCGTVIVTDWQETTHTGWSPVLMINQFVLYGQFRYAAKRNCDSADCCDFIAVNVRLDAQARDRIDWNENHDKVLYFTPVPVLIYDRLVRACQFGAEYELTSPWWRRQWSYVFDCKCQSISE